MNASQILLAAEKWIGAHDESLANGLKSAFDGLRLYEYWTEARRRDASLSALCYGDGVGRNFRMAALGYDPFDTEPTAAATVGTQPVTEALTATENLITANGHLIKMAGEEKRRELWKVERLVAAALRPAPKMVRLTDWELAGIRTGKISLIARPSGEPGCPETEIWAGDDIYSHALGRRLKIKTILISSRLSEEEPGMPREFAPDFTAGSLAAQVGIIRRMNPGTGTDFFTFVGHEVMHETPWKAFVTMWKLANPQTPLAGTQVCFLFFDTEAAVEKEPAQAAFAS